MLMQADIWQARSRRMSSSLVTKKAVPANRPRPCTSPSRCCRPASGSPPSISTRASAAFTHYVENRRDWATRGGVKLEHPAAFLRRRAGSAPGSMRSRRKEFGAFAEAVTAVESSHDFVVIDTPGSDSYLMRLAHSMADTLITPLNDSFVDFDVLGQIDPHTFEAHRRQPLRGNGARSAPPAPAGRRRADRLGGRAQPTVSDADLAQQAAGRGAGVDELGRQLGFRAVDGFAERVIYREFFPRGLTALDEIDEKTPWAQAAKPRTRTAREEVKSPDRTR